MLSRRPKELTRIYIYISNSENTRHLRAQHIRGIVLQIPYLRMIAFTFKSILGMPIRNCYKSRARNTANKGLLIKAHTDYALDTSRSSLERASTGRTRLCRARPHSPSNTSEGEIRLRNGHLAITSLSA